VISRSVGDGDGPKKMEKRTFSQVHFMTEADPEWSFTDDPLYLLGSRPNFRMGATGGSLGGSVYFAV
jgi:hypothetical protein